ncbi:MAG: hypothetical protein V4492_05640 [Chlamydiota bacterium]
MLNKLLPLVLCTAALHAAPAPTTDTTPPPALHSESASKSYMMIPMPQRAKDFQDAFEMLKREKSSGKVFFQLADGSTINNVIDMTLLTNSTLILFRYSSSQGVILRIVKVEEINSIGYM